MVYVEVTGWNPEGESVEWSIRTDELDEDLAIELALAAAREAVELIEVGDCTFYRGLRPLSFKGAA